MKKLVKDKLLMLLEEIVVQELLRELKKELDLALVNVKELSAKLKLLKF